MRYCQLVPSHVFVVSLMLGPTASTESVARMAQSAPSEFDMWPPLTIRSKAAVKPLPTFQEKSTNIFLLSACIPAM